MENTPPAQVASPSPSLSPSQSPSQSQSHSPDVNTPSGRKRSGSGGSILSKFPFLRTAESRSSLNESRHAEPPAQNAPSPTGKPPRALAAISQQQKTRRRKGSLRKVALLGRGAAREKRTEMKPLPLDTTTAAATTQALPKPSSANATAAVTADLSLPSPMIASDGFGLGISDATPRPSMDGYAPRKAAAAVPKPSPPSSEHDSLVSSPTISYTTTDEEDAVLSIPVRVPSAAAARSEHASLSSGSSEPAPYLRSRSSSTSIQRRRSIKHAKSPLSLQGLTAAAAAGSLPTAVVDEDHDYSETEWWGWVVLVVTWFVFVIGMGSCLNVWSWAWDVGTTPYAPPELEDDPTLPIVGYYPALLILTCIMAWVWVVVAWIGMKYFRHAKISGD
ncbi:hypothetical protein F4775DRAFT_557543 [Biscogniauxia sp. FL1348]|nr:hypothetical protein F4775DRAFT_557543 [Biscogniauxia sp. FL1348]